MTQGFKKICIALVLNIAAAYCLAKVLAGVAYVSSYKGDPTKTVEILKDQRLLDAEFVVFLIVMSAGTAVLASASRKDHQELLPGVRYLLAGLVMFACVIAWIALRLVFGTHFHK